MLGTFAIYYEEPGKLTMLQQSLVERVTHVASIAIERTQEAEALKRSEALLARVQQVSATGGFYWWPKTGEVYWSEQVYRIFELDPATPLTTELRQSRIHPDDLQAHETSVELAMREARDFEYEVRLLMPDGSVKYVHSLVQATRDAEGDLLYIGAVQDITQRRLSEFALSKVRSELTHVARVTTPPFGSPWDAIQAAAKPGLLHGPGRSRTCDLGIKSPLLYQLSYRPVPKQRLAIARESGGYSGCSAPVD